MLGVMLSRNRQVSGGLEEIPRTGLMRIKARMAEVSDD